MKIAIVGAGSYVFTRTLLTDFLTYPSLQDASLWLMDIEPQRLETITALARKMVAQQGTAASIHPTGDLRAALDGADYVFSTVRVGASRSNLEVPARYGVSLAVADTTGVGAAFYFLRNAPVIVNVARTMEEVAPDGLLLNYTNPMGMLCWAVSELSKTRTVGLCHSVQGTAMQLAAYIGAPFEQVSYWVAGLNHMGWFLDFRWQGEDAYPLLWRAMEDPAIYAKDRVRWDLMKHFGAFVSESSTHSSEYHPYFRRTPELIQQYLGLAIGGPGQPTYLEHIRERAIANEERRQRRDEENLSLLAEGAAIPVVRGREYGSSILNAIETGEPFMFNGSVPNAGLISNLLPGASVEVPIIADGTGLHPMHVGALPPALAALNRTALNCQELAVRGFVERKRELIFQAAQLDPLVAAQLPLQAIRDMVGELFEADAEYLTI